MPELPEVEVVKRVLLPQLMGRTIVNLTVKEAKVIACPDAESFKNNVSQATISGLRRRGKFLLIDLHNDNTITVHLRMTGELCVTSPDVMQAKHTHLVFRLDDGKELRYIDPRKFGRFWLLRTKEPEQMTGIHKLGMEPFDENLTADYLQQRLGQRKITIKQALLDQTVIAGIGNIYADEMLYQAGIYPGTKTLELKADQWTKLVKVIPAILQTAIQKNDITSEEYLKTVGQGYHSTDYVYVYGREGKPCPHCGTSIERMVIGGRSSHFCPQCQK